MDIEHIFYNYSEYSKRFKVEQYTLDYEEYNTYNAKLLTLINENMTIDTPEAGESVKKVASYIAEDIVKEAIRLKGDVTGRGKKETLQISLNLFMATFVFPSILNHVRPNGEILCGAIIEKWIEAFPGNKLSHATYDVIRNGFRKKIFGIF